MSPSFRAQLTTRRTYNRPLEDGGYETWAQTIDRVVEHQRWLWKRALGRPLNKTHESELEELRTLMLARKGLVAGRTLWLGGTDISRRRESSMFNPGRRSTKFITEKGVKSFEDYEDGDTVRVLTHLGNWMPAKVVRAGIQPINKITFSRGNSRQVEYFTPSHSWILKNGERTDSLKVGNHIWQPHSKFNDWEYERSTPDERLWWAFGFVFGDGTIVRDIAGNPNHSMVRLCNDKSEYLSRFIELGFSHSYPPSCKKDPIVYTGRYLKELPVVGDCSVGQLRAFVRGYLDADGAKNRNYPRGGGNRFRSIQATGDEICRFIEEAFPVVGVYIMGTESISSVTNFGERSAITRRYRLSSGFGSAFNMGWYKVLNIEPLPAEEVWCLTVDEDHSFVLPNGVVTGNCSHLLVQTVHDVVDTLWLLLQGCGVGFTAVAGTLNGFSKPIPNVQIVRSTRTGRGGKETNTETWDAETRTWTISIGDSAEAWAKSIGKLLAGKHAAETLVLDFSEIRPAGERLKGYGWISQGDSTIAKAYEAIAKLLSRRAGQLLRKMDIHDLVNWLGTILSTRRSAQISLMEYGSLEWREFATCKKNMYELGNHHREQSNNSLVFYHRPTKSEISELFDLMLDSGGSEPGFVNGAEALRRATFFKGVNPCCEILLADKSFCNLVSIDLAKFRDDNAGLHRAVYIMARANYRQTCVNLDDGILQRSWHESNEFLRLCGVSFSGQAMRPDLTDYDRKMLRNSAVSGAYTMANELGTPLPKNVTTGKPDGTVAKISDTTEGIHKPLGRYIFNNIAFSGHDPLVPQLKAHGYRVFEHPSRPGDVIATLPVAWDEVEFDLWNGMHVNLESAVSQLNRYKSMMLSFVEQNQSITISYDPSEVPAIVDWIYTNWDNYVGVSFLLRADPTKTAADLGYSYLPQEVVTKERYDEYAKGLTPFEIDGGEMLAEDGCVSGACPVR